MPLQRSWKAPATKSPRHWCNSMPQHCLEDRRGADCPAAAVNHLEGLPGAVDEQPLARPMGLAHDQDELAQPGLVGIVEPAVDPGRQAARYAHTTASASRPGDAALGKSATSSGPRGCAPRQPEPETATTRAPPLSATPPRQSAAHTPRRCCVPSAGSRRSDDWTAQLRAATVNILHGSNQDSSQQPAAPARRAGRRRRAAVRSRSAQV